MKWNLPKLAIVCVFVFVALEGTSSARAQAVWGDPGTSTFVSTNGASRFSDNTGAAPVCSPAPCLPTRRYAMAFWDAGATCDPLGPVIDPCTYLPGPPVPGGPADPAPIYDPAPDCNAFSTNAMLSGFQGHSRGALASASADYPWPSSRAAPCHPLVENLSIQADAFGRGVFDGIGTSLLTVRWKCHAITKLGVECTNANFDYCVYAESTTRNHIEVTVDGVPAGEPVVIHASWYLLLNTLFDPEVPGALPDDPADIMITDFRLAGSDLVPPGGVGFSGVSAVSYYPPTGGSGTILAQGGDTISIDLSVMARAGVKSPGEMFARLEDKSWALANGVLVLSLDGPLNVVPPILQSTPADPEFSLDIGSDTEISDPHLDSDEVFDPGDMYPWNGPLLPIGGNDGIRDDALIFGVDWWPQAPELPPPGTAALTCQSTGAPIDDALMGSRFDLDGSDTIGKDLVGLIPALAPLTQPILRTSNPIACVFSPAYLILSYDDDRTGHYHGTLTDCTVPVGSQSDLSPTQSTTYGTSLEQDEVLAVSGLNMPSPPSMYVVDVTGIRDEARLHQNLWPNPDGSEHDDDDVDALDIDAASCSWWYVSPDQEATGQSGGINLDAGAVYRVNPLGGSPVKVIDDRIHLGLTEAADVDAFEFVWLPSPSGAGDALALLFSVASDDPLTPAIDESGGLDPRQIYASFMDGAFFNYLGYQDASAGLFVATPLDDNVDAIAASPKPFVAGPCTPQTPFFADGFDAYPACGPLAGMGGWEVWPNPLGMPGAVYTSNTGPTTPCGPQSANSAGQSARIGSGDHVLQQLSINPVGTWSVNAHVYVPSTSTGAGRFDLLNSYDPAQSAILPPDYWSVQLRFDAANGAIIENLSGNAAPLVYDRWVPLEVVINFNGDTVSVAYDGAVFHTGSWTRGATQAALDLAAIDLLGDTISEMFVDDVVVWSVADCNGNAVADVCDIVSGVSADCQGNHQPDECDIKLGVSTDCNNNSRPDECDSPNPDVDLDGDVDDADFQIFIGCFTGPCLIPQCAPPLYVAGCCTIVDSDVDGDVDLDDFQWFQAAYTGP